MRRRDLSALIAGAMIAATAAFFRQNEPARSTLRRNFLAGSPVEAIA
jgi:hypothetical protein